MCCRVSFNNFYKAITGHGVTLPLNEATLFGEPCSLPANSRDAVQALGAGNARAQYIMSLVSNYSFSMPSKRDILVYKFCSLPELP